MLGAVISRATDVRMVNPDADEEAIKRASVPQSPGTVSIGRAGMNLKTMIAPHAAIAHATSANNCHPSMKLLWAAVLSVSAIFGGSCSAITVALPTESLAASITCCGSPGNSARTGTVKWIV